MDMVFQRKYIVFLLVCMALGACGNSYEERQRASRARQASLLRQDSLALKVAVLPTLDCLPILVAQKERLFDTLGVDVRLRHFNAQMDCDTALLGGSVEGMATDLVRAQRIVRRGTPLEYVAATGLSWQLVANRKARLRRLNQLGDRMVAMTRYSATDYLTRNTLDTVKLKEKVFNIQINNVRLRLLMLLNNEMDAMWLPEPQATKARLMGHNVLADSRRQGVHFGVIAFRKAALADKRRREQLRNFTKAYDMACDSINKRGFVHYAELLKKYDVDMKTIRQLPPVRYEHARKPQAADVRKADQEDNRTF